MAVDHPARKFAILLHADVAGSTALVQQNELLTHERIQATFHRFGDTIARYHGRVRELRGDALLAEFERASDAVTAALAFQVDQIQYNAHFNDAIKPRVRVGIAMGEVIVADNTVTGEGVVLAQRLEQTAEPGGVCTQGAVYETMPKRLPFEYKSLGERQLKGFDEPIRVYAVSLKPGNVIPDFDAADGLEYVAPDLPKKPSLAVLPFANMSGDPDQEYFSDGISEDLTTALSRFDWLFVIARNSAFTYRDRSVDVKQVGRELGVRYVLEGSVRRAGERVRINAQLVDAEIDRHVWADRFDRQMVDVFELQDDIVASIAATVAPEITLAEIQRARGKRPTTLNAWDRYLQATAAFHKMTEDDVSDAASLLEQAIDAEPDFANAYALLSRCYGQIGARGWIRPAREAFAKAQYFAEKAIRLAPSSPEANHALAFVLMMTGEAERAITAAQRAIDLNPSFADAHSVLGHALIFCGDLEGGLAACRRAERSNPRDSRGSMLYDAMGHAYFMLGEYQRAIEVSKKGLHQDPSLYGTLVTLAGSYAKLGRKEEAKHYVDELLRLIPRYSLRALRKNPLFVDPELIDKLVDSMRLAGLPE